MATREHNSKKRKVVQSEDKNCKNVIVAEASKDAVCTAAAAPEQQQQKQFVIITIFFCEDKGKSKSAWIDAQCIIKVERSVLNDKELENLRAAHGTFAFHPTTDDYDPPVYKNDESGVITTLAESYHDFDSAPNGYKVLPSDKGKFPLPLDYSKNEVAVEVFTFFTFE